MRFRVSVAPQAQRDLDAIIGWIARRSPPGAARLLEQFHRSLSSLANGSQSFGLAPEDEIVMRGVRQLLFKTRMGLTYRALFDVQGNAVRILRIRGPGQDLAKLDD
ncbi:MAG: type II toxin-antitoxin system RelE/ParE family toxin [Planctomycetaceae bacterium]